MADGAVSDLDELRASAADHPDAVRMHLVETRRSRPLTAGEAYLLAQLETDLGSCEEALALIEEAQAGFAASGDEAAAGRCDAGRSVVLENLGRHEEAAEAATRWVRWLETASGEGTDPVLLAQARSNLGLCLETSGRFEEALTEHDAAIAGALGAGDAELAATIELNRSNVLNVLGRGHEALDALLSAATVFEAGGDDANLALAASNAGETLCRLGRPDEGLAWFARAEAAVASGSRDHSALLVDSAEAVAALGATREAVFRFREALAALEEMPAAWLEGRAWAGLAAAATELGDLDGAADARASASARFAAAGNLPAQVVNEVEAMAVTPTGPARDERLVAIERLVDDLAEERWPVHASHAHRRIGELSGDATAADNHLRRAIELALAAGVPHLVAAAHQSLADARLRAGDLGGAEASALAALAAADRVRSRLRHGDLVTSFPATIAAARRTLVAARLRDGRVEAALAAVDAGRSRSLIDGGESATGPAANSERHRLEARLDGVYDRLVIADRSLPLERRQQLERDAQELEDRLGRLDFDAPRWRPRQAAGDSPGKVHPGEVQLVFHDDDGSLAAFLRTTDGVEHVPAVANGGEVGDLVAALHAAGRRAIAAGPQAAQSGALFASTKRRLDALGGRLLAPLRRLRGSFERLVIVPDGILHGVPFHALGFDGGCVADAFEVAVAPSLALRSDRLAATAATGPAVIVGGAGPGLEAVDEEIDAVAATFDDPIVLRGGDATLADVAVASAGASCLHLATHGVFRPQAAGRSGLQLADGWLSAERIAELELAGTLVVLSACDTGRVTVDGADELLGLQRGFFLAGATTVVVSHWAAVDRSAAALMAEFHTARRAGAAPAAALRVASLEIRRRWPHPWWWAPFFAAGAG